MEKIIIVGAGAHAQCVIAHIHEEGSFTVAGLLDNQKKGEVLGVPILGGDELLGGLKKQGISHAFPGAVLGANSDTEVCRRVTEKIMAEGLNIPNLVSSKAIVRLGVELSSGILIQPLAMVDVGVQLGRGVVVNSNVMVGHHCHIGDYAFFAGGAILNARLKIGQQAFIGMGAIIYCDLGAHSKVAPGTVVMEPVPEGHIAFGNPMRLMKRMS